MPYGGFSGAGGSSSRLSINEQNGDYTLKASDAGGVVLMTGPADVAYTLPAGEFSRGDVVTIEVGWAALGEVTIIPGAGVELSMCEASGFGPVDALLQTEWPARLVLLMIDDDVWDAAGANFEPG